VRPAKPFAVPASHGHDFSRLPVHAPAATASDRSEEEADRISEALPTAPVPEHAERPMQQGATATAVPNDLVGSAGQPLPSAVRTFMEPRLGHDLGHVRIHADASAARSAESLNADAYTYGSHIAFGPGRFAPATRDGNALIAHELVHSIQQVQPPPLYASQATPVSVSHAAPQIARRPKKSKKVTRSKGVTIDAGMRLGTNQSGEEVRVVREVGSNGGYDHRLQAIAVARLNGAEPAVIVQAYDGKWHAFQTTANFYGGGTSADIPALALYGLPSSAGIDAMQQSQPNTPALASLVFGVPESEIQMNRSSAGRTAGKINLNPQLGGRFQPGGTHGPVEGVEFKPGVLSAIEVGTPSLADPAVAQVSLFHEATHLRDYELAQQWVANYERETRVPFFTGAGARYFIGWLYTQARTKPPRLSDADADLIVDEVTNNSASTEARGNVLSFLAAFQAGKSDLAQTKLVAYAIALKPGGLYQNPADGSAVQAELTAEIRRIDRALPPDQRAKFRAAFAAAKAKNPDAWVSQLEFAK
jgi:hypothetical protein